MTRDEFNARIIERVSTFAKLSECSHGALYKYVADSLPGLMFGQGDTFVRMLDNLTEDQCVALLTVKDPGREILQAVQRKVAECFAEVFPEAVEKSLVEVANQARENLVIERKQ